MMMAERGDDGACERCRIQHRARAVPGDGMVQGIGEGEAALGIGVHHLHGQALGGVQDVAGAVAIGTGGVFGDGEHGHGCARGAAQRQG